MGPGVSVDMQTDGRGQRGSTLVEFAVLAPLLFLLIFGIIEFGWAFAQFNDVRHGAREGARFAAVDSGDLDAIRDRVCQSMTGLDANMSAVTIDLVDGGATEGDLATITVTATIDRLLPVPLLDFALPSTLTSEVDFRLEDDLTNWSAPSSTQRFC